MLNFDLRIPHYYTPRCRGTTELKIIRRSSLSLRTQGPSSAVEVIDRVVCGCVFSRTRCCRSSSRRWTRRSSTTRRWSRWRTGDYPPTRWPVGICSRRFNSDGERASAASLPPCLRSCLCSSRAPRNQRDCMPQSEVIRAIMAEESPCSCMDYYVSPLPPPPLSLLFPRLLSVSSATSCARLPSASTHQLTDTVTAVQPDGDPG